MLPVGVSAFEPPPPEFQTVADARGLPNGIVTALVEDVDGRLWVGSTNGLLRFDGHRFLNASDKAPNLPRGFVQSLLATADGRLWVGLQGSGLWVREPADGTYLAVAPAPGGVPLGHTPRALATAGDGEIWVGDARDGVRRVDASGRVRADVHVAKGQAVRALLRNRQGDLWIGHSDGLRRLPNGGREALPLPAFDGRYIYALYEATDGRLWVGTQAHGVSVVAVDGTVRHFPLAPSADGVGHPWVSGFAEWGDGQLWVASFGGGIEVRDTATGAVRQRIRQTPGRVGSLAIDRIQGLLVDQAGHLWFATWGGGLQRLAPGLHATQRLPAGPGGLSHPTIHASAPLPDGRLWLGVGDAGIDEVDTATMRVLRSFRVAEGLANQTLRSLLRTGDGQFWAAMQEGGLWRASDAEGRFTLVSADWPVRHVRVLAEAKAGGAWVGLERGLRHVAADGAAAPPLEREDGGTFDETVWSVFEDRETNLWVGTPLGLWWRPGGAVGLRPASPDADVEVGVAEAGDTALSGVLRLEQGPDGQRWMLARGGLYRLVPTGDGLRFDRALEADKVPQGLGDQLVVDREGVVWTGRVRFDPRDGRWQALGPADGLDVANQVWGASRLLVDGRLVLGSGTGLVLLDPARFRPWQFAPRVVAEGVVADGKRLPVNRAGVRVPAGTRRLVLTFAALDYSDPDAIRYRYRLEGLGGDRLPAESSQGAAAVGRLWPGEYTLVVEATNRVGDWSPHRLALPLHVEAAFWQTPVFLFAVALLVLLVLLGLLRWRVGLAAHRARALQVVVDLRTAELVQARDAAETALADLRGAQGRLVEVEKMASLGQMVAGVAHELNTPLGNALVVGSTLQERAEALAKAVEEGRLRRSDLDEFLQVLGEGCPLLVRSVERASDLVASFKQVAVDRSSSQRRRFDLAAVVGEALALLGPSIRGARCRMEVDVPAGIVMDSYPGAIGQIVGNMVNNAVLHAFDERADGALRIAAMQREGPGGSEVLLSFADDGQGMDEATRRKVFEPFFTTKMGRGGTGLGLNIVYNLVVQLLAGSITVQSTPGAGTRFELLLPCIAPASEPAAPD